MPEVMELIGVVPAPDWGAWEPLALSLLTAGAAALLLGCLSLLWGRGERVARPFVLAAVTAGLCGQTALFVSLEQPLRAYEFFVRPSFTSWTAAGAYIVPVFLVCALAMAWRTCAPRPGNRLLAVLVFLPGLGVFVYATNEIMACIGRALWTSSFVPPSFVIGGLAGGIGLATCFAGGRDQGLGSLGSFLAGFAALGVAGCAVMTVLLPPATGFAEAITPWWHAPDVLCLLATGVAVIGWRRPRLGAWLAGLCGILGDFLLFWKLIQMGQAFARNAATVADRAAFLDLFSGAALLPLAGTTGLLLALGLLLPVFLPERPQPHGVR